MGQELIAKLEQIKPEQPLGRYEHKFRLSQSDYLSVKTALFAFCELDPNCKKTSGSYYTVRSEYFDTADFEGYVGKVQGEYNRNKFRIRCYSANPNENTPFKIEQKHRIGSLIYKSADNVN